MQVPPVRCAEGDVQAPGHTMLGVGRADAPVLPLDQFGVGVARLDAEDGAVKRSDAARSDMAIPTWSTRPEATVAGMLELDTPHMRGGVDSSQGPPPVRAC
jgi:hypothetical protein